MQTTVCTMDLHAIASLLERLKPCIADFDPVGVDEIVESFDTESLPEGFREDAARLMRAIRDLEYKSAMTTLERMEERLGQTMEKQAMTDVLDDLSKCRVLLVDDVKDNINVLVETLKNEYRLGFALNGADALAFAKSQQPDLILLDIMMPVMDGYETCRRLKADPVTQDIPVLFITALDEIENKTAAFDVGAVDYIIKPFEITEIRARVKTHLTLKLARQTLAAQRDRLQQSLDLAMEVQQSLLPASSDGFPRARNRGQEHLLRRNGRRLLRLHSYGR